MKIDKNCFINFLLDYIKFFYLLNGIKKFFHILLKVNNII